MKHDCSVTFTLKGFHCSSDEITAKVGIPPFKTWKAGDLINSRGTICHQSNGWRVKSRIEKSADLDEQVISVLDQLQPAWEALTELCTTYDADISCVIYAYPLSEEAQFPAVNLDRKLVKKIAELNATLDIDVYLL